MQVPDGFVLPAPLNPESFPLPSPPLFLKHQVYDVPEVFNKVDQHAIYVSKREHMTFRELMWDLVYRVRLQELEKARVIFRWMTSKNMYEIQFEDELPGTPEDILTSFRKRKGTLARIMEVMCCYAHIPCISISGYAKGVEYLPGQKFHGRPANHSWNAIFIQNSWQLIDAHWATRYLSSDKNVPENLVYEYDDFYFIMEPQQAVYSHFPNNEAWQLLDRPLTLQQFEDLPLTKSQFFKCGMDFRQQHHGVVHTREGKLKMCLGFWKPGSFTYGLQYGESMVESFSGIPLKNYALQETLDLQLNFFFRLPLTGVYYLTVYASDAGATGRTGPTMMRNRDRQVVAESVFRAACEYKIVCDTAAPDAAPYPACHDVNWGPAWPLINHYGLVPSISDGVIPTYTGAVEVRFQRQKPEVNLLAKLHKNGVEDEILDQFLQEYVTETGDVVFTAQLPEGGEYGMEIYANDPEFEEGTYTHICQYMISFQAPAGYRSKLKPLQQQQAQPQQGGRAVNHANPRQMWNYEDHAPSMGTLPQPYLANENEAVSQMTAGVAMMQGPSSSEGKRTSGAYQYQPAAQVEEGQFPPPPTDLPPPPPEMLLGEVGYEPDNAQGNYRMGPGNKDGYGPRGTVTTPVQMIPANNPPYGGRPAGGRYQSTAYVPASSIPRRNWPGGRDQYNRTAVGEAPHLEPVMAYNPEQSTANWSRDNVGMMPPPEFHPEPVEAESAPKPVLSAIPHEQISSRESTTDVLQKFEKVDTHAMDVSKKTQDNFTQLIWQLIYARNITDDLEKVRAIFAWLCTKDLSKMNFIGVKENTPEDILMGIKTGKSTYAQIFQMLCQYAGVHCTIVPGYAKGAEYVPGMRFSGRQGQHSWNAVLISGVWRLVDCHWAARRLIGKQSSVENIRYELDMFYFLPNPIHLIYTHFPFESDWQLMRDPIPLPEFESLAPVKSAFFKYGLQLQTHRHAVISCAQELTLKIAHPPGTEDQLSFTYTLGFADAVGSSHGELEEWNGLKLIEYGMQEMTADDCSTFTVRPPRPGAYKFLIYAKRANAERPDIVFGAVCEYKIEADFPSATAMPPFPPCQNHSYGPCEAARRYGLASSSPSAVLQTGVTGVAEVRVRLSRPGVRMMAKLRSRRHSEDLLARCLLMRHIADREVIVSVFPPDAGEFGLELYASEAQTETTSYYMVWQHLVVAQTASPVRGLPTIPASFLGPLPKFSQYGLEAVSHVDPFIQTNTGELCVQIRCNAGPLRMMAQLVVATNDANDDCTQYILQQSKHDSVYFLFRFPRPGYYKFIVFALPFTEQSESIPAVFNYLVEASSESKNPSPFPQQFQQWKEGCYLNTPLDGQISPSGAYIKFDMEVPKATAVAVVIADDWTQLEKKDGEERWTADVYVEKHLGGGGKRVSVCANYGQFNANYSTILEYAL